MKIDISLDLANLLVKEMLRQCYCAEHGLIQSYRTYEI